MKMISLPDKCQSLARPALLVALTILTMAGCTSTQLRHNTVAQTQTYMGMEYEMVLDNLAMFSEATNSLPWHLNLTQGIVTVNDSVGSSLGYSSKKPSSGAAQRTGTVGISASRAWTGEWKLTPVSNSKQLAALEELYNSVIQHRWTNGINRVMPKQDWFNRGASPRTLDCPSGRHGSTVLWVDEAHRADLAALTLQVLKIAGETDKVSLMQIGPSYQIQ